jgi:hypothetical protein
VMDAGGAVTFHVLNAPSLSHRMTWTYELKAAILSEDHSTAVAGMHIYKKNRRVVCLNG